MNHPSRYAWRVIALGALLVGPVTLGAEVDDDYDDTTVENVPRVRVRVVDVEFNFQDEHGEVFNRAGARERVNLQLKVMLDEIVHVCELNEAQQQKFLLAARIDMARFFDRVELARGRIIAAEGNQDRVKDHIPDVMVLRQQFSQGLFGDKSLFAKTLRQTLTEEQHAKHQVMLLDRRRTGYKVAIQATLSKLGIGLNQEQIEALQKLLLEETRPPLRFGPNDRNLVVFRLSQLPEARLKQALDKSQWKKLHPLLLQASGFEDSLIQNGVIEESKPIAPVVVRSLRTVVDSPVTAPADAATPE